MKADRNVTRHRVLETHTPRPSARKPTRQRGRLALRAVFSRPKGQAKSEFAGMIACAEALGPVRFDSWDANGDPVGRSVRVKGQVAVGRELGDSHISRPGVQVDGLGAHDDDRVELSDEGLDGIQQRLPGHHHLIRNDATSSRSPSSRQ